MKSIIIKRKKTVHDRSDVRENSTEVILFCLPKRIRSDNPSRVHENRKKLGKCTRSSYGHLSKIIFFSYYLCSFGNVISIFQLFLLRNFLCEMKTTHKRTLFEVEDSNLNKYGNVQEVNEIEEVFNKFIRLFGFGNSNLSVTLITTLRIHILFIGERERETEKRSCCCTMLRIACNFIGIGISVTFLFASRVIKKRRARKQAQQK